MKNKSKVVDEQNINTHATREKIELCREALIHSIAFFEGYHKDYNHYPIILLDDLKDLLETFLDDGVLDE